MKSYILECNLADVCNPSPCQNSGECDDNLDSYSCRCQPGFLGDRCEEEVDECASSPCENGGACTDRVNGFRCSCVPGFTGITCETDVDECDSSPCDNNGTCIDEQNSYTCDCGPEYTGATCQIGKFDLYLNFNFSINTVTVNIGTRSVQK